MKKYELVRYSFYNEEELSLLERIRLSKLTTREDISTVARRFNVNADGCSIYQIVYFSRYLNNHYSFYLVDDEVYVAPAKATKADLKSFNVPETSVEESADEFYISIGIGYRENRQYKCLTGVRYRLHKGRTMSGYPSVDIPWHMKKNEVRISPNSMLEFFSKSRKKNGVFNCKYAFRVYDQQVTWEEFEVIVYKYASSLKTLGICCGDIVPVCVTSTVEASALFFACDLIGAITFFVDPVETNVAMMNSYFNRFGCKLTFTTCRNLEKVKSAVSGSSIVTIVVISPEDSFKDILSLSEYSKKYIRENTVAYEESGCVISLSSFINLGKNNSANVVLCKDNSLITLLTSTSSSTGEPKLVELSRENIMFELESVKETTMIHFGPKGINMQVVPFKYPYGFVISCLISPYVGKTAGLTPDFSLNDYVKFFDMYKPVYLHTVPSHIRNMLVNEELQDKDMSFLRFLVSGGDKFDTFAKKEANVWLKNHHSKASVKDGSGMAEVTAGITASTVGKYNIESVGKPLLGTIVKAVDSEGNELPYNHVGKLYYSGRNVMQRYNGNEQQTKKVRIVENDGTVWIATDSYGMIDKEGFVYMCGRERDFFITYPVGRPPFKVYIEFVEKTISDVDSVVGCCVVKKPDKVMDCVSVAYVVIKEGANSDNVVASIKERCKDSLDECAIPVDFIVVPELKVSASMKTDKKYYEKLAAQGMAT